MSRWALPAIAVMLIAYGAVSGRLRSTPVSQSMVFVTLGLLAVNQVHDLADADSTPFVRRLAEATLALVLFTDAVRVNRGRLRHESALPTRLLGVGLPLTIVAGTLAGLVLLPQAEPVDGRRAGHHAGPHRCRPGPAGGHQPAAPLSHPTGPQRRERPQ